MFFDKKFRRKLVSAPISFKLGCAYVSKESMKMKKKINFFHFFFLGIFCNSFWSSREQNRRKIGAKSFFWSKINRNEFASPPTPLTGGSAPRLRMLLDWIPLATCYRVSLVSVSESVSQISRNCELHNLQILHTLLHKCQGQHIETKC